MEPIAKKMRCAHKPISWPLLQATPLGVHLCDVAGQVVVDAVDKEGAAALLGIDAGDVSYSIRQLVAELIKFTHDPAH